MVADECNQKQSAIINGGHGSSRRQTIVDGNNGRLTRSMEKELISVK